jgi:predicted Fe-Mo cluster-binding NifX family protein
MKRLWLTLVLALLGFGVWSLVVRLVKVVPSTSRVAIATMGRDMDSPVSADFSKARYFLIVDTHTLKVRSVRNPYAGRRAPVGLRTGELLLDDQVGVVLTRGARPAASNCLRARGIRVVQSGPDAVTAEQALQQYLQTHPGIPVANNAPQPGVAPAAVPAAAPAVTATATLTATPTAAEMLPAYGLTLAPRPDGSALITGVVPGSRAALAGLQPGDVLVSMVAMGATTTLTLLRNNLLLSTRI